MSVYSKENQVGGLWFENWNTAAYAIRLPRRIGATGLQQHCDLRPQQHRRRCFSESLPDPARREVYLYAKGYRYDYVVEDAFVVHEMGAPIEQRVQKRNWINTTIDERVTLVSCWPPMATPIG
ncbi:MAG: hypothetical protein R2873_36110 [Caldilineaceae bacterium]